MTLPDDLVTTLPPPAAGVVVVGVAVVVTDDVVAGVEAGGFGKAAVRRPRIWLAVDLTSDTVSSIVSIRPVMSVTLSESWAVVHLLLGAFLLDLGGMM